MSKVTTYNKLVRDKIPGIIAKEGKSVRFTSLKGNDFKHALEDKLLEEVQEFIKAETREQLIEELADIFTVIESIKCEFNIGQTVINNAIDEKAHTKGFFYDGYFLEEVEEVEDDAR